ncbi:hypothetical protein Btru_043268 [Bulinus truncatus]|nr:hypothetical protein Btru_043268 [Bulinus truncatus]
MKHRDLVPPQTPTVAHWLGILSDGRRRQHPDLVFKKMSKRAEFLILMSFHSCSLIVALADTQTNAQCCLQEHYLSMQGKIGAQCVPCPMGSYCKKNYRNETLCLGCSVANLYDNEVIMNNCTPISDAVIGCAPDFFRRQIQHEFDCARCTKCHNAYEARRCTGTTDTVCCPTPGMDAVPDGRGGFKCGLTCKRGQYLNTGLRRCLPCPARTYMPADDHNYTSCWLCFNYQSHHDRDNYRLVQLCDAENNEEIICKPGFYKKQIGVNESIQAKNNSGPGQTEDSQATEESKDNNWTNPAKNKSSHGDDDVIVHPHSPNASFASPRTMKRVVSTRILPCVWYIYSPVLYIVLVLSLISCITEYCSLATSVNVQTTKKPRGILKDL